MRSSRLHVQVVAGGAEGCYSACTCRCLLPATTPSSPAQPTPNRCLPTATPACVPAVILDYLSSKRISSGDLVVVSPDVGGVARARAFAKKLNDAPLAIVDKRRSAHNVSRAGRGDAGVCVG